MRDRHVRIRQVGAALVCAVLLGVAACSSGSTDATKDSSASPANTAERPSPTTPAPPSPPDGLVITRVGGVQVAAPNENPDAQSGSVGRMWTWVGETKPLVSINIARRNTNVATEDGVQGTLQYQVDQTKESFAKAPSTSSIDVDVRGAEFSAGAALEGTTRTGVPVRRVLVLFTDGDRSMYRVSIVVLRGRKGTKLASQIVGTLALT